MNLESKNFEQLLAEVRGSGQDREERNIGDKLQR
jgi:hypothetical protein